MLLFCLIFSVCVFEGVSGVSVFVFLLKGFLSRNTRVMCSFRCVHLGIFLSSFLKK